MRRKLTSLLVAVALIFALSVPAYAATTTTTSPSPSTSSTSTTSTSGSTCGTTQTQLLSCDSGTQTGLGAINNLIKIAVTILSVLIGVVAVGGLAYAAIMYASAQDDQNKISEARGIIRNIIIGLVLYVFTIGIISWLIPGSIIGGTTSTTTTTTSPSPSTSTTSDTSTNSSTSGTTGQ